MAELSRCPRCEGLVPSASRVCPHCERPFELRPRRARQSLALGAVGAGIAAVTLMACYGMPPCDRTLPDGGQSARCFDVDDDAGTGDAGTKDAGM